MRLLLLARLTLLVAISLIVTQPESWKATAQQSSSIKGGSDDDKGLMCRERHDRAQSQFRKECVPAFAAMTTSNTCQSMCLGNQEFPDNVSCRAQCTDCLSFLQVMERNKGC